MSGKIENREGKKADINSNACGIRKLTQNNLMYWALRLSSAIYAVVNLQAYLEWKNFKGKGLTIFGQNFKFLLVFYYEKIKFKNNNFMREAPLIWWDNR